MDERKNLPRLTERREVLQYRIFGNNEQIRFYRDPKSSLAEKEVAIANLMAENALFQAEIEELNYVLDRNTFGSADWSRRAYVLLLVIATVVMALVLYAMVRVI